MFHRLARGLITTLAFSLLVGCGSQSSTTGITVAFTPGFTPPTSMMVSQQCGIAATVTNDPKNAGVNWSVTCGSTECGSFSPFSTASAVPTTYTAPSSIPSGNTVTVTATSVTDSTKSVSSAPIPITENVSQGCTAP